MRSFPLQTPFDQAFANLPWVGYIGHRVPFAHVVAELVPQTDATALIHVSCGLHAVCPHIKFVTQNIHVADNRNWAGVQNRTNLLLHY
jgi:hypothetical protein